MKASELLRGCDNNRTMRKDKKKKGETILFQFDSVQYQMKDRWTKGSFIFLPQQEIIKKKTTNCERMKDKTPSQRTSATAEIRSNETWSSLCTEYKNVFFSPWERNINEKIPEEQKHKRKVLSFRLNQSITPAID